MGIKTIFFIGTFVGSMLTIGWGNFFEDASEDSIATLPKSHHNNTIYSQNTQRVDSPATTPTNKATTPKDIQSEQPTSLNNNEIKTAIASRDGCSDSDVYAVQDETILEVIELEKLSVINNEREIALEIENVALFTSESMDQYDPVTGRTYDEIEEEQQFEASQFIEDETLAVEKKINELAISTTEEGSLASPEPVE